MSYFEKFNSIMSKKYSPDNESEVRFLFKENRTGNKYIVEVIHGKCNIIDVSEKDDEFTIREEKYDDNQPVESSKEYIDLVFDSTEEIFDKIIDDEEDYTGVDAYFDGDLELEGDRAYLEDLFDCFGIV